MLSSTERFTTRVDDYVKYRPSYPSAVMDLLSRECGLREGMKAADVGSGTGIFARHLLDSGAQVFAVEPNEAMRLAAERLLGGRLGFHSVAGTADATGLPAGSVALVTAAQSFHWFDRKRARDEFSRVLSPGGSVVLVWNERLDGATPFLRGYEEALRKYAAEYSQVRHRDVGEEEIRKFFAPSSFRMASFPNEQCFDAQGLFGRALSSSYCPQPGQPGHEGMMEALRNLFEMHQEGGHVSFLYRTVVYHGVL